MRHWPKLRSGYEVSEARAGIRGIGMTSARTRDRLVQRLVDQGIRSPDVLERIRNVPRHMFVDEALASRAYEDTALPIGLGQTISQPFVVARMTEALLADFQGESVLELHGRAAARTATQDARASASVRCLQRAIQAR
jgi:protein-L-isoaspartate(D-aspartate) O-methyltransferase